MRKFVSSLVIASLALMMIATVGYARATDQVQNSNLIISNGLLAAPATTSGPTSQTMPACIGAAATIGVTNCDRAFAIAGVTNEDGQYRFTATSGCICIGGERNYAPAFGQNISANDLISGNENDNGTSGMQAIGEMLNISSGNGPVDSFSHSFDYSVDKIGSNIAKKAVEGTRLLSQSSLSIDTGDQNQAIAAIGLSRGDASPIALLGTVRGHSSLTFWQTITGANQLGVVPVNAFGGTTSIASR